MTNNDIWKIICPLCESQNIDEENVKFNKCKYCGYIWDKVCEDE